MVNIQASPGLTLPRKPWSLLAIILRLPSIPLIEDAEKSQGPRPY